MSLREAIQHILNSVSTAPWLVWDPRCGEVGGWGVEQGGGSSFPMQNNRNTVWGCGQEFRALCTVAGHDLACLLLYCPCSTQHFNSQLANCPGNRGQWALVQKAILLEGGEGDKRKALSSLHSLIFPPLYIYGSILQRNQFFFVRELVSIDIKKDQ